LAHAKAVLNLPKVREREPLDPGAIVISKHPNRLRYLREINGMSQKDAAQGLGVPTPTLNRHEQGNRSLDGFTIQRYAEFYGVTPFELFVSKEAVQDAASEEAAPV
jgi:transcriptional regulator with XRE-family HTH domain